MVLEFAVGRYYQTSVLSCLCNIGKRFKVPGIVIVGISFAILSYYLVVLGWIFSFTVFMIIGSDMDFESFTNSWLPVLSFVLVIGFTYAIIRRGITKGIENLNKIGVVLLILFLVPLAIFALLLLANAENGISLNDLTKQVSSNWKKQKTKQVSTIISKMRGWVIKEGTKRNYVYRLSGTGKKEVLKIIRELTKSN